MQKNKKYIFFYSHLERHFKSTLIGHLYLLMDNHDVILFSEDLTKDTLSILNNRELFPRLKVIDLYKSQTKNSFIKNLNEFRNNTRIFDQTFKKYSCKSLVASSDWHSLNELYLMRIARKRNIFRFSIQESVHWNTILRKKWYFLRWNSVLRKKLFFLQKQSLNHQYLSSSIINFLTHSILWSKYLLFQFLIPILSLKKPFFNTKTFFLWNSASGSNDSQYHITFSPFEYEQYQLSGTSRKKLKKIPHPFTLDKLSPLQNVLFNQNMEPIDFLIILDSFDMSFKKDKSTISKEIKFNSDIDIIKNIAQNFYDKRIMIKPHPNLKDYELFKTELRYHKNITFVDQSISVDSLFSATKVLIAFSPSFSTSSIYFKLFYPNKKSIALDILNEYNGDFFQNNKYDVHYVKSIEDFNEVLSNRKNLNASNKNFNFDFENINQFLSEKLH